MISRQQNRVQDRTHRPAPYVSQKNSGTQPDAVPADEQTEGATGALETPATAPEMAKDGNPESNSERESR
jgi:hypothetical protein